MAVVDASVVILDSIYSKEIIWFGRCLVKEQYCCQDWGCCVLNVTFGSNIFLNMQVNLQTIVSVESLLSAGCVLCSVFIMQWTKERTKVKTFILDFYQGCL